MVEIDGSAGEGGGQVLRTSLALSLVTRQPFRIANIRAGRERPGLLRQHLTGVRAAVEVGGGDAEGAELGATALAFTPGRPRPGSHRFSVGTAGSAALVLQTVAPALLVSEGVFELEIEGGTHAESAPPFEFLDRSWAPLVRRMGGRITLELERHGFYPAGGGLVRATVHGGRLEPLNLPTRGPVLHRGARALVANVPFGVAQREVEAILRRLRWERGEACAETVESPGPGNAVIIEIASEHVTEIASAFGKVGLRAESVAERAVQQVREYLEAGVPVGRHLADQLVLLLALAGGGSFRTLKPTPHATTNATVIEAFLPVRVAFEQEAERTWRCEVSAR